MAAPVEKSSRGIDDCSEEDWEQSPFNFRVKYPKILENLIELKNTTEIMSNLKISTVAPEVEKAETTSGVVVGCLTFREDGDWIDCAKSGSCGNRIPANIEMVTQMKSTGALFILLVENGSVFDRLAADRYYKNKIPCIIMTSQGRVDVGSRQFLTKMTLELKLPVFALVDCDPRGFKILKAYSCDSARLHTPDILWLGLRPTDVITYHIPPLCMVPMTEKDMRVANDLLEEEEEEGFMNDHPIWKKELELMIKMKKKADIQMLNILGFRFLTDSWLPFKLQKQDWI